MRFDSLLPCWQREKGTTMHYFAETQNIARFTAPLRKETRPKERVILAQLLADEEAKLAAKVAGERAPIASKEPPPGGARGAAGANQQADLTQIKESRSLSGPYWGVNSSDGGCS